MAILSYADRGSRDVAAGVNSKESRRVLPIRLHPVARRRLAFLAAAATLDDLAAHRGLNLHALSRDKAGQHAIRINEQYRICFHWKSGDAELVRITDYH